MALRKHYAVTARHWSPRMDFILLLVAMVMSDRTVTGSTKERCDPTINHPSGTTSTAVSEQNYMSGKTHVNLSFRNLHDMNLPRNFFVGRKEIQTLNMTYNCLQELPSLQGLINLEDLDVSHNWLILVRYTAFRGLEKLRTVDLGDNLITTLEYMAFANLPSLRKLNLASNLFRVFPPRVFFNTPNLTYVNLVNVPLMRLHHSSCVFFNLTRHGTHLTNPWGFADRVWTTADKWQTLLGFSHTSMMCNYDCRVLENSTNDFDRPACPKDARCSGTVYSYFCSFASFSLGLQRNGSSPAPLQQQAVTVVAGMPTPTVLKTVACTLTAATTAVPYVDTLPSPVWQLNGSPITPGNIGLTFSESYGGVAGDNATKTTTISWSSTIGRQQGGTYSCAAGNKTVSLFQVDVRDFDECNRSTSVRCPERSSCVTTNGSSVCQCSSGFRRVGWACIDVNECATDASPCDVNADCTNINGSYTCACRTGFSGDGRVCVDVDECARKGQCGVNARCANTPGSYACVCNNGFSGDGQTCVDVNECESTSPCHAYAKCRNKIGSYRCKCKRGYYGNGKNCTDVDECASASMCHTNANCVNSLGSYSCTCDDGYYGNGTECTDVNECLRGLDKCHENAHCTNTLGAYMCTCRHGYIGNGTDCTDVDECLNASTCHSNATCTNNLGSYLCVCKVGFHGNGNECTDTNECLDASMCHSNATCSNNLGSYECTCNSGYYGDGKNCRDVDECVDTAACHSNATCTNELGSYLCTCDRGYYGNGENCTDTNECMDAFMCHSNATCSNNLGSYECTCDSGYYGDGENCTDVDECVDTFACHSNATCTNQVGSYMCTCNSGYYGDGENCTDIDECVNASACHSNATCTNSLGSYLCGCDDGFHGNGEDCADFDECSNASTCHSNATCTNNLGAYTCTCDDGYVGNGENCTDYNECLNQSLCHPNAFCTNNLGSYMCLCDVGYDGSGEGCEDIDECLNTSACHSNATCTNNLGSYTCACDWGYHGNGNICTDIDECLNESTCHRNATCTNNLGSYICTAANDTQWDMHNRTMPKEKNKSMGPNISTMVGLVVFFVASMAIFVLLKYGGRCYGRHQNNLPDSSYNGHKGRSAFKPKTFTVDTSLDTLAKASSDSCLMTSSGAAHKSTMVPILLEHSRSEALCLDGDAPQKIVISPSDTKKGCVPLSGCEDTREYSMGSLSSISRDIDDVCAGLCSGDEKKELPGMVSTDEEHSYGELTLNYTPLQRALSARNVQESYDVIPMGTRSHSDSDMSPKNTPVLSNHNAVDLGNGENYEEIFPSNKHLSKGENMSGSESDYTPMHSNDFPLDAEDYYQKISTPDQPHSDTYAEPKKSIRRRKADELAIDVGAADASITSINVQLSEFTLSEDGTFLCADPSEEVGNDAQQVQNMASTCEVHETYAEPKKIRKKVEVLVTTPTLTS